MTTFENVVNQKLIDVQIVNYSSIDSYIFYDKKVVVLVTIGNDIYVNPFVTVSAVKTKIRKKKGIDETLIEGMGVMKNEVEIIELD